MTHLRAVTLPLIVAAALLAVASACGSDDNGGNGEPTMPPLTAASPTRDDGDGDGSSTITLVAKDTLWDQTKLEVTAGEVTFTVDNRDGGIVHNLHIYKGTDNTGEDIGETELEAGPVEQTLTVTFEPGTYFFVCDVHPATMAGTIEVEDEG